MIVHDAACDEVRPNPEKIGPVHLQRLAVVYVRQSTAQQVLRHEESTRLQYGLASRAQELGVGPRRGSWSSTTTWGSLGRRQRAEERLQTPGLGGEPRPRGDDPRSRDLPACALF